MNHSTRSTYTVVKDNTLSPTNIKQAAVMRGLSSSASDCKTAASTTPGETEKLSTQKSCKFSSSFSVEPSNEKCVGTTEKDNESTECNDAKEVKSSTMTTNNESTNEDKKEEDHSVCPCCGKAATLLCTRCRSQKYCSRDCQKTHWTNSHKQQCKSAQGRIIVVDLTPSSSGEQDRSSSTTTTTSTITSNTTSTTMGAQLFPLKIQVALSTPIGVAPMMCYNETRTLQCLIHTGNCTKANLLEKKIRDSGPMGGAKEYFNASIRNDGKLAISMDQSLGLLSW